MMEYFLYLGQAGLNKKKMKDYQGKTKKQVKDSEDIAFYCVAGFIIIGCIYFIIEGIKLLI